MGTQLSLSLPILIVAAALQSSLVPQIRVLGGGPDFVLLIVLSWAANSDFDEALTWAFVGGIAQDLLSVAPTGTSTIGLLPLLFATHLLNRQLYRVGFLLLALLIVSGTIFKETVFATVSALAGYPVDYIAMFSYVILPSIVYNLALLAPTYWFVRRVQKIFQRTPRVFQ